MKSRQISMRCYQQGPSDETLNKARCRFCDAKFRHRIIEAVGLFDYEMRNFIKITLNFTNKWRSNGVVSWFSDTFCTGDNVVNYMQLNKWK